MPDNAPTAYDEAMKKPITDQDLEFWEHMAETFTDKLPHEFTPQNTMASIIIRLCWEVQALHVEIDRLKKEGPIHD